MVITQKRRLLQEESGQTVILSATFLALVAMGFLAFAIDVGLLFREKRMAQSAADACALAAAAEVTAGYPSNKQTVANGIARQNGFDTAAAVNPATVVLSTPSTGSFQGAAYVQATVSQPVPTYFLRAFASDLATMNVSASAIAGGSSSSPTCVCLEGTSGQVLNLSNGTQLNATECGVVDNSNSSNALAITGGAMLSGLSLGTVSSTWNTSSNINSGGSISPSTKVVQGISTGCSPKLPVAPTYSGCVADPGGTSGTFTWGPASPGGVICYTALTIGANGAIVTLQPGTYVISAGALHFMAGANNHSNLGGNGVFFYLTGTASLVIDNGSNTNLVAGGTTQANGATAPTVGNYNGILLYQAANDVNAVSIQGGSTSYLNGSVFAPAAAVSVSTPGSATVAGGIVAKSLSMSGGAVLKAVVETDEGTISTGSAKVVQ